LNEFHKRLEKPDFHFVNDLSGLHWEGSDEYASVGSEYGPFVWLLD